MPTRRKFIASSATAATVAFSGCSGILGDGGDGGGSSTSGPIVGSVASNVWAGVDADGLDGEITGSSVWTMEIDPGALESVLDTLPGEDHWAGPFSQFYFPKATLNGAPPDRALVGTADTHFADLPYLNTRFGILEGTTIDENVHAELGTSGSPDATHRGFDVHSSDDSQRSWGIGGETLLGVGHTYFFTTDEDPPSTRPELRASVLQRQAHVLRDDPDESDRVSAVMDAVEGTDVVAIYHKEGDVPEGERPLSTSVQAYDFGPEELTYQIAFTAPDQAAFDAVWNPQDVRERLRFYPVAQNRSPDVISSGPTLEVDGTLGVGSVTVPTADAGIDIW